MYIIKTKAFSTHSCSFCLQIILISLNQMVKVMNHNKIICYVISWQDEQSGSSADPSSTNPYHMSIEEYFNPPPGANTRGKTVQLQLTGKIS